MFNDNDYNSRKIKIDLFLFGLQLIALNQEIKPLRQREQNKIRDGSFILSHRINF